MRFAARIFPIFLFLIAFLFFLKPLAFAQTPPVNTNPDVPNNLHTWTQNVMIEVTSSLTCLVAGIDPTDPKGKCLGIDPQTHKIGYVESGGGAIGLMGGLIAMTFTPPARTADYVNYLSSNFGIVKPALAADNGIGFSGLTPLLDIWTAFRNIAYLLFVIIFIVIGFAIMFRVHIDPRTVMTIENQIPKIIVALLLVTFSFAIAGLMIDLMYLGIYLVFGIFDSIPHAAKSADFANVWGLNPLEVVNNLPVPGSLGGLAQGGIVGITANASTSITNIIATLFSGLTNIPLIGLAFQGIVALLAFLIIAIAILFAMFRLWFTLIQAYIFLLLDVIFAPFWMMAGLIPGGNLSFTSWLRETGAEILAFPATIVMFLLARTFLNMDTKSLFVPPLIGNPNTEGFGALMGLGVLLMTPNVVNMMKGWLKAPRFDITSIAQAIGAGTSSIGRTVRGGAELAFGPEIDPHTQQLVYGPRAQGPLGKISRVIGLTR